MRISRLIATTFLLGGILLGSTAWAEDAVRYSGFLDHYPDLKQHPNGSGGLIYEKAGIDHCSNDKIMNEPIEVWMAADSKYKGFSPNVLTSITDELYRSLVINLEPDYPVVGSPGKGVLVIRLAITDVYGGKRKRGLTGYLPLGAVIGAVRGKYRRISFKDATIEVELLDAQSLDQLGVLIDKMSVSREGGDQTSWVEIMDALHFYAKRFRSKLDAEHSNC